MSESIVIPSSSTGKTGRYESLIPQIKALTDNESDLTANLSNIMAALKFGMNFFWAGCYFVKVKDSPSLRGGAGAVNELVLGPFQGPVACTRIAFGKGACGTCWKEKKIIMVEDVNAFPGHIACNTESKSEIVLPAFDKAGEVALVLDVDSDKPALFDDIDKYYLQQVVALIEDLLNG